MQKRVITEEDLYQMKFTGSPELSPVGRAVVHVVTEVSKEKNGYSSSLYWSDLKGDSRPFTHPYGKDKLIRDTMPKWSPNGEAIAFLSNRSGEKPQIWLLSVNGGEAQQVTHLEEGVNEFNWSADGKRIVFTAEEIEEKEENEDVFVTTRLRYKANGEGFRNGYSHVWIVDLETNETEKLTSGSYNYHSPAFTPSGAEIVYLASKNEDREWVNLSSLYLYDLKSKTEKKIYHGKGPVLDPSVSPDGKQVAFVGHEEGESSSANFTVWTVLLEGGEARNLLDGFDYTAGNHVGVDASYDQSRRILKWAEDGQSLFFLATIGGDCGVMRVDLDGNVVKAVNDRNSVITSFDVAGDTLVFVKADPHSSGDLYVRTNEHTVQLSRHNEKLYSELSLSTPESFTYQGADGWEIEGWFLPPIDRKDGEKVPVVLEIHGGPHTAYGNAFHHEFQLLAARGYAVVYTNPRGSHGYGDKFVKACIGDWGNKDREDILLGLDYVLEHYPYCDPDRLYVTGGSYGGIMTNFIITRTNRFRAAVTQRCISNMYSFFGTSDIGFYFGSAQLGGVDQWEDEDTIMEFSPIRYARNVKTPTCIIHSEEDYRCPIEQAEQWYVALTRLGVETKFVRFKSENHELSRSGKPKNRVRRLQEIIGWFDRYEEQNKEDEKPSEDSFSKVE